ncbi:sigma-70 family RNA polymerase sigma factor [Paracoccus sp. TK19116]|uniref:Sigma-70 family RNA polymerase sigma factor n=1 Tax=Paracoccus albicereus TaxID=2922394 RepID=A0ABT1MMJ6_9RHOB|nr:sigma-70 family RNA polymerase sigma factor [Paracoccus albicereus]MCQ0969509.1 sigma-70 family RNA polymerase sigma factor [Paracoccus albicereus]
MSDDILSLTPSLRAYSRVLCRNRSDAEDLVQETLLRAIEYAHQYRPGTNLRAWMFKIMRNLFFTQCRKSARERTGSIDCASERVSVGPGQEWHMMALEVRGVLDKMPSHYRNTIVLVGALGVSYLDAAELLDCDIGTIKSRMNRARGILRTELEL